MELKIEGYRVFCAVVKCGNLTEAANLLARTPSALSMTLKQFEENIGGKLFEGERKNRLTPLGIQVYNIAQNQLRSFDEATKSIENLARAPQGLIRMASIPSVAGRIFTEVVQKLQNAHPNLKFELRDAHTQSVLEMLAQGQIDIGIASGQQSLNNVESTALLSDRFGMVCAKGNPIAEQILTLEKVQNSPHYIHNLTPRRSSVPRENTNTTAHNTLSLIAMLSSGPWVSILPQSVVQLAPNTLQFVEIPDLDEQREVTLYTRQNTAFPIIMNECANMIKAINWLHHS